MFHVLEGFVVGDHHMMVQVRILERDSDYRTVGVFLHSVGGEFINGNRSFWNGNVMKTVGNFTSIEWQWFAKAGH
jgi:hypothetical protein